MLGNLVVLLVFGAIVGWLASIVVGRNKEMGCLANIVIGVLGALIAGLIIGLLFPEAPEVRGINLYSIVLGVAGAVLLLLVTGWFRGKSA